MTAGWNWLRLGIGLGGRLDHGRAVIVGADQQQQAAEDERESAHAARQAPKENRSTGGSSAITRPLETPQTDVTACCEVLYLQAC